MKMFETAFGSFINIEKIIKICWFEDMDKNINSRIYLEGSGEKEWVTFLKLYDFFEPGGKILPHDLDNVHFFAVEYLLRDQNALVRYCELKEYIYPIFMKSDFEKAILSQN